MTYKMKGKDRSESKLRSFVDMVLFFPSPSDGHMWFAVACFGSCTVYFSCQMSLAVRSFVGFGIQAYVKVSASVFVRGFHCAIVESYDQGCSCASVFDGADRGSSMVGVGSRTFHVLRHPHISGRLLCTWCFLVPGLLQKLCLGIASLCPWGQRVQLQETFSGLRGWSKPLHMATRQLALDRFLT